MQNPPISWKPRWIIVALRELWLPSPDYFLPRLACLDQSSFIFSVTRERSSIFSGIRILSFLYQVILIPASLQDTDPDLWAWLADPLHDPPGFPLLIWSIAGLCCCLSLAWDDSSTCCWMVTFSNTFNVGTVLLWTLVWFIPGHWLNFWLVALNFIFRQFLNFSHK